MAKVEFKRYNQLESRYPVRYWSIVDFVSGKRTGFWGRNGFDGFVVLVGSVPRSAASLNKRKAYNCRLSRITPGCLIE